VFHYKKFNRPTDSVPMAENVQQNVLRFVMVFVNHSSMAAVR